MSTQPGVTIKPVGIDLAPGGADRAGRLDRDDRVAVDRHIGESPLGAGAVDQRAVANHQIVHGRTLAIWRLRTDFGDPARRNLDANGLWRVVQRRGPASESVGSAPDTTSTLRFSGGVERIIVANTKAMAPMPAPTR